MNAELVKAAGVDVGVDVGAGCGCGDGGEEPREDVGVRARKGSGDGVDRCE